MASSLLETDHLNNIIQSPPTTGAVTRHKKAAKALNYFTFFLLIKSKKSLKTNQNQKSKEFLKTTQNKELEFKESKDFYGS